METCDSIYRIALHHLRTGIYRLQMALNTDAEG
jgi:hypothetical protein